MNPNNHIAKLRPDKFLGDEYFRYLFIGHEKNGKSEHEYREVKYFPEETFMVEDDGGEKMFFIPIELVHDVPEKKAEEINSADAPKKNHLPVPIFMLDLQRARIEEIKKVAKQKHGLIIADKYFRKPIIAMCYSERLEKGLELDEENDDDEDETIQTIEIIKSYKKITHINPYSGSSHNYMH